MTFGSGAQGVLPKRTSEPGCRASEERRGAPVGGYLAALALGFLGFFGVLAFLST
jgi:hypothetical protein